MEIFKKRKVGVAILISVHFRAKKFPETERDII